MFSGSSCGESQVSQSRLRFRPVASIRGCGELAAGWQRPINVYRPKRNKDLCDER